MDGPNDPLHRPARITLDYLMREASLRHLSVLGGFHPGDGDTAPEGCQTLILLGPAEPSFWPEFTATPEYLDGAPDPMDRWSSRVIGSWAKELGAQAVFPFGQPPHQPFYQWALRTGRAHESPIRLLVHDAVGLFVSFRGGLALRQHIELPKAAPRPCLSCLAQPCVTACPVAAFGPDGYDTAACKKHIATQQGAACLMGGCIARRACPVSERSGRCADQSAFHMRHFLED